MGDEQAGTWLRTGGGGGSGPPLLPWVFFTYNGKLVGLVNGEDCLPQPSPAPQSTATSQQAMEAGATSSSGRSPMTEDRLRRAAHTASSPELLVSLSRLRSVDVSGKSGLRNEDWPNAGSGGNAGSSYVLRAAMDRAEEFAAAARRCIVTHLEHHRRENEGREDHRNPGYLRCIVCPP